MSGYYERRGPDPQAEIRKLRGIIKSGEFPPVFLLYGDEEYLVHQLRDDLVKAMGGGEGSLNYTHYTGKDTDPAEVMDQAETLPFLAERRVILIEDTGWFENGNEEITEYIRSGICPTTTIVFCETKVDGKRKIYNAVKEAGVISKILKQTEDTLKLWLMGKARACGLEMPDREAAYLVTIVGKDMLKLQHEMDKLLSYCLGKQRISHEDIVAVCSRSIEDRVFEMCGEIALQHKKTTLAMYNDLMALQEKGYKIIVLIARHFDLLLKVKDADNGRRSADEVALAAGRGEKKGWTVEKQYRPQAKRYSRSELARCLELCVEMLDKITSGAMEDGTALEILILRLLEKEL